MKQTAVEWLQEQINKTLIDKQIQKTEYLFEKAKEIEKQDIDNKVIHFAEWLTKKHITALITLYEQFEEQYYNETFKE
jgi:hypothetical protein